MINFKDYLTELHTGAQNTKSHIRSGNLPLTYPMMRRLGLIEENVEAYRISSVTGFNRIEKQQKSKKQTSAFTKPDRSVVDNVYVAADFVLKLKGTKVIGGDSDIWTLLDGSGRRWLSFGDEPTTSGRKAQFSIIKMTAQAYRKRFNNIVDMMKDENINPDTIGDTLLLRIFLDDDYSTSIERNEMYKIFFDEVEKWLKSNVSLVKGHIKEMAEKKNGNFYNEVVLTKFVITGYYILEGFGGDDIIDRVSRVKNIKKYKELGIIRQKQIDELKDLG